MLPVLLLALQAQNFDLVLKGGRVIDPKNNLISVVRDIAIKDGRIAAVHESIADSDARRVVDAKGLIVTPGLIDLHVHVFHTINNPGSWAGDLSIPPDTLSFRTGVTTMVDAGSSGWRNFEQFKTTVIDRSKTRVLALINIAGHGMVHDLTEQGDFNAKRVAELAQRHKDVVVGIKSAHYTKPDWTSVDEAVAAGKIADIPVMVDFGYFLPERPYWKLLLEHLRPGDISTHVYRAPVPWIDDNGKIFPYLKQARDRGVILDMGHGGGSFAFRNAVPAIAQGFYPDTISTDLHDGSMNNTMQDMPNCMAKALAMGMPLEAVIRASTWKPAQVIKREDLGHLTPGAIADIALWRMDDSPAQLVDSHNAAIPAKGRLRCEMTLREGRVAWDASGRMGTDLKKLNGRYGLRKGIDSYIVPPSQ